MSRSDHISLQKARFSAAHIAVLMNQKMI